MVETLIYYFSKNKCDGDASMCNLLGTKGANLAEMCQLDIPVPPGFTITSAACNLYHKNNDFSYELCKEYITLLENETGRKFGNINNPLLVSVRSGSVSSMPGMLDTILNVGLNDETLIGLIKHNGERFAYDSYCRFIQMYCSIVLKIDHSLFNDVIENEKRKNNAQNYSDLSYESLQNIVTNFKDIVYKNTDSYFPQDVHEQLYTSIIAVFDSWKNSRAASYRRIHNISDEVGTAVNIQSMVFGNMDNNSATGVVFTRNPSTGQKEYFGEFLINAQGEDIVAGTTTPWLINGSDEKTMANLMPEVYRELCDICNKLEAHYCDMQDIEFTVENGKLWILQTRSGKRTAEAAIRIAQDMVNEKLITKEKAILKIDPHTFDKLLHPIIETKNEYKVIAKGLPASPGVACGQVAFTSEAAKQISKQKAILVRLETNPEDIEGINASCGIITVRGGMTSHAAVVARGMGRPCICGANGISIDESGEFFTIGEEKIYKGDYITINGSNGEIIQGTVPIIQSQSSEVFQTIMSWTDEIRILGVRANADTPEDVKIAQSFNSDGIGLCRTEHMFFSTDRIKIVQELITAETDKEQESALSKLEIIQKNDFKEIFTIMQGKPITIRLLDPPLHEFLPQSDAAIEEVAKSSGRSISNIKNKILELSERNPMLGHRGCRLAISHPKIYEMQTRAIFSAIEELQKEENIRVVPEIMIPFIIDETEFSIICSMIDKISKSFDYSRKDYLIGTMIELPRAALTADKIAKHADFFSFGTNDLTQTTMGLSRDDATKFLDHYHVQKILKDDPFEILDISGVGELIKIAVDKARKTSPKIKLGVCGEHGGNPESIKFFAQLGIDYVSCSPFRIPIAKLTAAQCSILKDKDY
ncbi:MAG: pyruvate, phosphate dikinase [Candidatus Mesenet longicola]|uniref:Pyruvate, phosphate dikinase n=1 Tax=Candidatus Mesenet longicola TaxID=1892558 RepID=A0A8J3HVW8_9RICK|nr:MAG: pyruvate, phosphate dikinase [Candidatus Mesenet longicola]GHM59890.1 MAG: pyruvate, phosphate dikinase [Candidatus Mesenet longicola]